MNEIVHIIGAMFIGAILGVVFFGGLWWTVRRGVRSSRPASLFFFSMLLRTAFVLTGFYMVAATGWKLVLACFVGFIAARLVIKARVSAKAAENAP